MKAQCENCPNEVNTKFLNNLLANEIITNYNWKVAPLALCHELSGCLRLGTPLLSSWWTVISIWSKATFVTWIAVPPSQIGMLSISKVRLQNNSCLQLPLSSSVTTVRSFSGLEASTALILVTFSPNPHDISRSLRRASWRRCRPSQNFG